MAFGKKKNKKKELENIDATDSLKEEVKEEIAKNTLDDEEETDTPKEEVSRFDKRKTNGPFKGLGWVAKLAAAAILVALVITMSVNFDDAQLIVITITGAFITLLCFARIIFYFVNRKKYSKNFKILNIIEIIVDAVCGIFLLACGIYYQNNSDNSSKFVDFLQKYYRLFVGTVIYLRGALHFFATAFFKHKSTISNYFVNLIFVTLGTFCVAYEFTLKQFVIVLIVVAALSCLYLAFDGIKGAINYWNGGNDNRPGKEKKKDKKKKEEIPAGVYEPEKQDQAIVS